MFIFGQFDLGSRKNPKSASVRIDISLSSKYVQKMLTIGRIVLEIELWWHFRQENAAAIIGSITPKWPVC